MEIGKKYEVVVEKIIKTGAIVRFVDEDIPNGFIHISNIADAYIDDIHNFIDEGSTYIARCIEGKVRPQELSLKELCLFNKSIPTSKTIFKSRKPGISARGTGNKFKSDSYRRQGFNQFNDRKSNYKPKKSGKREYRPKADKSLDEMISEANSHLVEKLASRRRK